MRRHRDRSFSSTVGSLADCESVPERLFRLMKAQPDPHIAEAERIDGGVLITFVDGKSALYSAALLQAMFSQADEVVAQPDDEISTLPSDPHPSKAKN
jgi:hypothetical protein